MTHTKPHIKWLHRHTIITQHAIITKVSKASLSFGFVYCLVSFFLLAHKGAIKLMHHLMPGSNPSGQMLISMILNPKNHPVSFASRYDTPVAAGNNYFQPGGSAARRILTFQNKITPEGRARFTLIPHGMTPVGHACHIKYTYSIPCSQEKT